ncbi:MAG: hypothetical protein CL685_02195 [Candidatus Magasanikbacteria bacterium]|nr:hypothetical protein [Candidatus Magasanikbacteria bacterium]
MKHKKTNIIQILETIIERKPKTKAEFDDVRRKVCSSLKISQPSNSQVLAVYKELLKQKKIVKNLTIEHLCMKAGIRSTSGIAVVTSLVKPYACPGKCVYCPTEVRMPKSYIASEPAAARSLALDFDPYLLMQKRIEMLEKNGHPVDKIEYITKGGTWNAYTLAYQYWYIMESFNACNNLTRRKQIPPTQESDWVKKPIQALIDRTEKEQRYNEKAKHRIIGITLETRPDCITPKTIYHMRKQGCTRIELGLQAPDDAILSLIKRGHTVNEFKKAMYLLRCAGFKVDLHFMPDLPGTTPTHDIAMYTSLFSDPALCPDMVKIYPNTVIKSAELYQWFKKGKYKSYGDKALFRTLLAMKKATPRYCRISRLIRDIPSNEISDGNTITNLRESLAQSLKQQNEVCACLRCREISRQVGNIPKDTPPQLFVDTYKTVGGIEHCITFEDPKRIAVFGFLRLRIPKPLSKEEEKEYPWAPQQSCLALLKQIPEIKNCAFIRELHVYGQLVKIGEQKEKASQHKGLGKKLMKAAEDIIQKEGIKKSAVISGVGVRGYYKKLGYRKVGTYMIKKLY